MYNKLMLFFYIICIKL